MFSLLNIEDLLKSAEPDGEARGGKYVHREWTGEYWRYFYNQDKASAHGFTAVSDLNDTTFSHSLHVVAEKVSGDPEKDYKSSLAEVFRNPDESHKVPNPQGGDALMLNLVQNDAKRPVLRLTNSEGTQVKDFHSRDAYMVWYLGVSNTSVFMDHTGTPMFEVKPLIGKIIGGELNPNSTKSKKTLITGEDKEYKANSWQVTYHKDYPEDRQGITTRWLKSSRTAAESFARKKIRDQAITSGESVPSFDDNQAVEGAKSTPAIATPGSVADKIQSGKLKWKMVDGNRELDATQGEKDALIAQAAREYYPVIVKMANQMASNRFLTTDSKTNFYGASGKWGWVERFVGSDVKHTDGLKPDFIFPDEDSPTYKAIDQALNTFDPAMGVGFSGYFAGKQGTLYWKMRAAQDEYVGEFKNTAPSFQSDDGTPEKEEPSDTWRESVTTLMRKWEEGAPEFEREKRTQVAALLTNFDKLSMAEKDTYATQVQEVVSSVIDWRKVLGKSLTAMAVTILQEEVSKAAGPQPNAPLTRNKQVDPTHTYSHMEGEESNPRYYYSDPMGNLVRYSNAPMGDADRSSQYGDAELHPSEPQFQTNPEYFTPDGRKLSRSPDMASVEWNPSYNAFDPKNLWIGKWTDQITGVPQYTYLDADLRTFPKLRIHQLNASTDTRIEALRAKVIELFQSDKIKDQMTALALILLDQGKMRAIEITSLTPNDVTIEGSIITAGNRKMYGDPTVVAAFEILKKFKSHEEPLFTVPLQKQDGDIDQDMHRRIGPNYLSAVLEQLGLSLLGLQTYHATIKFIREMSNLLYTYNVPWDAAVQQSVLAVVLEWGHDFSNELDAGKTIQLAQAVLIDPIVVQTLQANAKGAGLMDNTQVQIIPEPTVPVPYVSVELTGKTTEEQTFSQWLHSAAIHEYVGDE